MPYENRSKRAAYDAKRRTPRRGRPSLPEGEKKLMVTWRMHGSLLGRMRRIVDEGLAKGTFPWKTMTSCAEALLLRGLESLSGEEIVDEMLPYLRAVGQIDSIGTHRREAQSAFSKVKTEIAELLAIRAHAEAVQYFHATYHSFEQIGETVWRDWLLKSMQTAFPKLYKQKPKGVMIQHRVAGVAMPERRRRATSDDRRRLLPRLVGGTDRRKVKIV
jgi:hypothetical protein